MSEKRFMSIRSALINLIPNFKCYLEIYNFLYYFRLLSEGRIFIVIIRSNNIYNLSLTESSRIKLQKKTEDKMYGRMDRHKQKRFSEQLMANNKLMNQTNKDYFFMMT